MSTYVPPNSCFTFAGLLRPDEAKLWDELCFQIALLWSELLITP